MYHTPLSLFSKVDCSTTKRVPTPGGASSESSGRDVFNDSNCRDIHPMERRPREVWYTPSCTTVKGQLRQSLTRVTKSYLLALGTTQISSYFTKHYTKFLTHQTGNYPVTCFVSKPSRITLVELSIINTSYQKLPFGSGDYPVTSILNSSPVRRTAKWGLVCRLYEPVVVIVRLSPSRRVSTWYLVRFFSVVPDRLSRVITDTSTYQLQQPYMEDRSMGIYTCRNSGLMWRIHADMLC